MAVCDKCGSEDIVVTTWYNEVERLYEYKVQCNQCGNNVKFKGTRCL